MLYFLERIVVFQLYASWAFLYFLLYNYYINKCSYTVHVPLNNNNNNNIVGTEIKLFSGNRIYSIKSLLKGRPFKICIVPLRKINQSPK